MALIDERPIPPEEGKGAGKLKVKFVFDAGEAMGALDAPIEKLEKVRQLKLFNGPNRLLVIVLRRAVS